MNPTRSCSPLEVIAGLAESAGRATHLRSLVTLAGAALEASLAVVRLEIRPKAGDQHPLEQAVVWVSASGDESAVIETIDLSGMGVQAMVEIGHRGDVSRELWQDDEFITALTACLALAHHGCTMTARLARLSRRAHRDNRELRTQLSAIKPDGPPIAVSSGMRRALELVELVAMHPTAVLLRGESGTGKEVLARWLHQKSDRADGPFVVVNCAALPPTLIESELFGHEKGAFTGANHRRVGRFEAAERGTLFLDELAELPLVAQAKLLRVLQERSIERVGDHVPIAVDVRIVAATHQPLETMMAEGRFRHDLFQRLNVFPIVIPPLHERPEDIIPLARAKLRRLASRTGRSVPALERALERRLCELPLPGNVRELENILERMFISCRGGPLRLPASEAIAMAPAIAAAKPIESTLDEIIAAAISATLRATGGRVYGEGGAAQRLGLAPSTLQAKMRKLGIQRIQVR